ncbi:MAG TPA: prolipoprotein diacylglyceryl transferase [Planctomycetota bacterium]
MWPQVFSIELFGKVFPLRSFGLVVAVGFLVGIWWGTRLSFRYGSDPRNDHRKIPDLAWWILVGIVGGGRLAYVIINWGQFAAEPWRALFLWEGGMVMYGGLILAVLLAWWKVRRLGMHPWMTGDYGLTAGFLGQAIGRWGCLAVGDDYGAPSTLPWAIRIPEKLREGSLFPPELAGMTVHPTQIYMSLKALALCLLGVWLLKRRRFKGQVMCILLGGYAVLRFLVETVRWDSAARGGFWKSGLSPADVDVRLFELGVADPSGRLIDVEAYRELLRQGVAGVHPELLLSSSQIVSLAMLPLVVALYVWLKRRPDAALPAEDGSLRSAAAAGDASAPSTA